MVGPDPVDAQALERVVDAIMGRAGEIGALHSVKELVNNWEQELAVDHLVGILLGREIPIRPEEFFTIRKLSRIWDTGEYVEDLAALVTNDPGTHLAR